MDGQPMQGQDFPGALPTLQTPMPERDSTPAEAQFVERDQMQRAELEDIRRRLEFGRADVAAMEKIERSLVAGLEVNEPNAKMVPPSEIRA